MSFTETQTEVHVPAWTAPLCRLLNHWQETGTLESPTNFLPLLPALLPVCQWGQLEMLARQLFAAKGQDLQPAMKLSAPVVCQMEADAVVQLEGLVGSCGLGLPNGLSVEERRTYLWTLAQATFLKLERDQRSLAEKTGSSVDHKDGGSTTASQRMTSEDENSSSEDDSVPRALVAPGLMMPTCPPPALPFVPLVEMAENPLSTWPAGQGPVFPRKKYPSTFPSKRATRSFPSPFPLSDIAPASLAPAAPSQSLTAMLGRARARAKACDGGVVRYTQAEVEAMRRERYEAEHVARTTTTSIPEVCAPVAVAMPVEAVCMPQLAATRATEVDLPAMPRSRRGSTWPTPRHVRERAQAVQPVMVPCAAPMAAVQEDSVVDRVARLQQERAMLREREAALEQELAAEAAKLELAHSTPPTSPPAATPVSVVRAKLMEVLIQAGSPQHLADTLRCAAAAQGGYSE